MASIWRLHFHSAVSHSENEVIHLVSSNSLVLMCLSTTCDRCVLFYIYLPSVKLTLAAHIIFDTTTDWKNVNKWSTLPTWLSAVLELYLHLVMKQQMYYWTGVQRSSANVFKMQPKLFDWSHWLYCLFLLKVTLPVLHQKLYLFCFFSAQIL